MRFFGVSIFSGAFLLFLVQPLMARLLTPAFGGSASVWICCLLFFQIMLVLGYGYSHLLSGLPSPARQRQVHAGLGLLALGGMAFNTLGWGHPLLAGWATPLTWGRPLLPLLLALIAGVGLPFLWLSATSPLVQSWFQKRHPGENPYRLYALSNAGSLVGLLAFPFLLEPALGMRAHALLFALGFLALWGGMLRLAPQEVPPPEALAAPEPPERGGEGAFQPVLILLVAAVGTLAFMALTVRMIAVMGHVPLLWVSPFALYLVSFILPFEGRDWIRGRAFQGALAGVFVLTLVLSPMIYRGRYLIPTWVSVGLLVFSGCTLVHTYLCSLRPKGAKLTLYYLYLAVGGALGGLFVGVASPVLYNRIFEYPLALLLISVILIPSLRATGVPKGATWGLGALGCGLSFFLLVETQGHPGKYFRDFYGAYSLRLGGTPGRGALELYSNDTLHGAMDLKEPLRPTTYYGVNSGFGRAIQAARTRNPHLRIGLLGLGAGSAMLHTQAGDRVVIYEISHQVLEFAGARPIAFPFVAASKAETEILEGDGRILLEADLRKGSRQFDVLLVDAFSGGSIPWHLMTSEALQLYRSHLREGGLIVMHLSNNLPLDRVVATTARGLHLNALGIDQPSPANPAPLGAGEMASRYVLLSADEKALLAPQLVAPSGWVVLARTADPSDPGLPPGLGERLALGGLAIQGIRPWEDAHCSLVPLLFTANTHRLKATKG